MNVQITCRHTKVPSGTQDYIKGEVEALVKYYDKITSAHVVLDSDNPLRKSVEIDLHVAGHQLTAHSTAENYGKAAEESLEKITRQLKKQSDKIKSHKGEGLGKAALAAS